MMKTLKKNKWPVLGIAGALGYYFLIHKPKKAKAVASAANQAAQVEGKKEEATAGLGALGSSDYGSLGSYTGGGVLGSCGTGSLC